jgi:hypothetical protein
MENHSNPSWSRAWCCVLLALMSENFVASVLLSAESVTRRTTRWVVMHTTISCDYWRIPDRMWPGRCVQRSSKVWSILRRYSASLSSETVVGTDLKLCFFLSYLLLLCASFHSVQRSPRARVSFLVRLELLRSPPLIASRLTGNCSRPFCYSNRLIRSLTSSLALLNSLPLLSCSAHVASNNPNTPR